MMRITLVFAFLTALLRSYPAGSAVVITSNDFNSFAAAVQSAPPGTTFTFALGSNSTIPFAHPIRLPSNTTFIGNNGVIFDGGGASSLFGMDSSSSNVSFSGCTFQNGYSSNNGGAIGTDGGLTVSNCSFLNNRCVNNGGAIASFLNGPPITVTNCLFVGNQASNNGGAILCGSRTTLIENSTFTANHAGNNGGAIVAASDGPIGEIPRTTIINDTIFGNSCGNNAGGVETGDSFFTHATTTYIFSSLIAGNTSSARGSYDVWMTSAPEITNCLVGSPNGTTLGSFPNGNIVGDGTSIGGFPIANLLGPLQDNGGPTQTMALLNYNGLTNPAIDHGSNPNNFQFDQRGSPFARTVGPGTDIGAFEVQTVPEIPSAYMAVIAAALAAIAKRRFRLQLSPSG